MRHVKDIADCTRAKRPTCSSLQLSLANDMSQLVTFVNDILMMRGASAAVDACAKLYHWPCNKIISCARRLPRCPSADGVQVTDRTDKEARVLMGDAPGCGCPHPRMPEPWRGVSPFAVQCSAVQSTAGPQSTAPAQSRRAFLTARPKSPFSAGARGGRRNCCPAVQQ